MYRLRLSFEWGGGALWAVDEATLARYGAGAIEGTLGLAAPTLARLAALSVRHETTLNWTTPAGAALWSPQASLAFNDEALRLADELRIELGADFSLVYQPL
jgi:hypothetical protein